MSLTTTVSTTTEPPTTEATTTEEETTTAATIVTMTTTQAPVVDGSVNLQELMLEVGGGGCGGLDAKIRYPPTYLSTLYLVYL